MRSAIRPTIRSDARASRSLRGHARRANGTVGHDRWGHARRMGHRRGRFRLRFAQSHPQHLAAALEPHAPAGLETEVPARCREAATSYSRSGPVRGERPGVRTDWPAGSRAVPPELRVRRGEEARVRGPRWPGIDRGTVGTIRVSSSSLEPLARRSRRRPTSLASPRSPPRAVSHPGTARGECGCESGASRRWSRPGDIRSRGRRGTPRIEAPRDARAAAARPRPSRDSRGPAETGQVPRASRKSDQVRLQNVVLLVRRRDAPRRSLRSRPPASAS